MTRRKEPRARLRMTWFALALGALALLAMPGAAAAKDRNHDRIPDRWEKKNNLTLKANQARKDQDRDHLRNRAEFLAGDDPRDEDSDDDGVADGDEGAGTIESFDADTGRLVIDLFGDETIAGFVTDGTEIECEDHGSGAAASSDDVSGESEPGDDNAGDGEEVGDDSGDQGEEEPGEDQEGDNSGPGSENDEGDDVPCTAADLVPGAVVEEAELEIAGGKAIFEEVELSGREV